MRTLRSLISESKEQGDLSPEVVFAYAALHIVDDLGLPITPAAHHRLWMQLACDTRIKKLLIIAPPEAAKTTWLISAFVGCYVGYYPESNIIITSASGDVAKRRSMSLRATVQSGIWRETFPGVLPANRLSWEMMNWSLAPDGEPRPNRLHPTVSAYGTGGAITGSRGDLIIADDVLDFENTRTPYQIEIIKKWLHNSVISRLKSQVGRLIIIGTAWTHDDIYAEARQSGDFVVCHTPLLSVTNRVYANISYPDDWPHEMMGEPISGDPLSELLPEGFED